MVRVCKKIQPAFQGAQGIYALLQLFACNIPFIAPKGLIGPCLSHRPPISIPGQFRHCYWFHFVLPFYVLGFITCHTQLRSTMSPKHGHLIWYSSTPVEWPCTGLCFLQAYIQEPWIQNCHALMVTVCISLFVMIGNFKGKYYIIHASSVLLQQTNV